MKSQSCHLKWKKCHLTFKDLYEELVLLTQIDWLILDTETVKCLPRSSFKKSFCEISMKEDLCFWPYPSHWNKWGRRSPRSPWVQICREAALGWMWLMANGGPSNLYWNIMWYQNSAIFRQFILTSLFSVTTKNLHTFIGSSQFTKNTFTISTLSFSKKEKKKKKRKAKSGNSHIFAEFLSLAVIKHHKNYI